jgi:hypothetical protein
MAIKSLKSGTFSRSGLVGNPVIMPGSYESIATTTVSTATASITFSSIPATYTHLQIRWIARDSGTTDNFRAIKLQFNSDTGTNYSQHILFSDGSSAQAYNAVSANSAGTDGIAGIMPDAQKTASTFAAGVWDILDYANTSKYKTTRLLVGVDLNGSGRMSLSSGLWMNTNAITSITITDNNNNFVTNTQFALYGIA